MIDQPKPTSGAVAVFHKALSWVYDAMIHQKKKGEATYGQPLMTWDGRYYHVDLMQELADAQVYATKGHMERLDLEGAITEMRAHLADTRHLTAPLCNLETCGDCGICTINARTELLIGRAHQLLATSAEARQRNGDFTPESETVVARPKRVDPTPVKRWMSGEPYRAPGHQLVGTVLSATSERLPDDRAEDRGRDAGLCPTPAPGGDLLATHECVGACAGETER